MDGLYIVWGFLALLAVAVVVYFVSNRASVRDHITPEQDDLVGQSAESPAEVLHALYQSGTSGYYMADESPLSDSPSVVDMGESDPEPVIVKSEPVKTVTKKSRTTKVKAKDKAKDKAVTKRVRSKK